MPSTDFYFHLPFARACLTSIQRTRRQLGGEITDFGNVVVPIKMKENLCHYGFRSKYFDLYMNVPDKHVMGMSSNYQFVAKCNNVLKNCFFFILCIGFWYVSSCTTGYLARDKRTASDVRTFESKTLLFTAVQLRPATADLQACSRLSLPASQSVIIISTHYLSQSGSGFLLFFFLVFLCFISFMQNNNLKHNLNLG